MKNRYPLLSSLFFFIFLINPLGANTPLFTLSSTEICGGEAITITPLFATFDDYFWDFGNGSTSTEINPGTVSYAEPGVYNITLQASDAAGMLVINNVTVNSIPGTWGQGLFDPLPDLYLVIRDSQGNFICSTPAGNYNFSVPHTFQMNAILEPQNYTLAVWEYDLFGGNDYLGTVAFNGSGTYSDINTGMQLSINAAIMNEFSYSQSVTVSAVFGGTTEVTLCQGASYALPDGTVVNESGTYSTTSTNAFGCDSTFITQVTFLESASELIFDYICSGEIYTLPDGQEVTVSGVYQTNFTSVFGCDSIVVTNLSVSNPETTTILATVCKGDSYELPDGNMVQGAGNYSVLLTNNLGCDSTVLVELEEYGEMILEDTIIIANSENANGSISLQVSGGNPPYDFLWNDGSNGPVLTGLEGGTYTVTVTDECLTFMVFTFEVPDEVVGVFETIEDIRFKVYPNPFNQYINIDINDGGLNDGVEMQVFTTQGQLISKRFLSNSFEEINMETLPSGLYLLRFMSSGKLAGSVSVVKE